MGRQFYESTLPRVATALERIATAFEGTLDHMKKEADARREETEPVQVPVRGEGPPPDTG
jgi:hypothetical protein